MTTVSLAPTNSRAVEGNSGQTNITFTASLSAASATEVSVGYRTGGSSATSGIDFIAASGTLTFLPGETSKTFTVAIVGDTDYEPNEIFEVVLQNPVGVVLDTSGSVIKAYEALFTITNDDASSVGNRAPTLSNLPTAAQTITPGIAATLADFTVADADNNNLAVTLMPTNGLIGGLTDANSSQEGIQLTGTAASINTALAGATFTATAAGAASIAISVSDGVVTTPTTGTYSFTAAAANRAPTLSSLPTAAQGITAGTATALVDFTVADADNNDLTVTLTSTNGTLGGLTDANPTLAGIQLTGTAASINTAIAGATFTATAAGAASIAISVSDGGKRAINHVYRRQGN